MEKPYNNSPLGKKLRILRENRSLTQQEVARRIGVDRSTYSYYETGKSMPRLNKLIKLAHYYHVSTDFLLSLGEQTENSIQERAQKIYKLYTEN